jgi:hypothetical protein
VRRPKATVVHRAWRRCGTASGRLAGTGRGSPGERRADTQKFRQNTNAVVRGPEAASRVIVRNDERPARWTGSAVGGLALRGEGAIDDRVFDLDRDLPKDRAGVSASTMHAPR